MNGNGTLTVNGRAKAGAGKAWLYGINPKRLEAAREKIADSDIESRVNLEAMFQFTKLYLGHAADLARSDKKDAARNWVRFFTSSHVLDVLADGGLDVSGLRKSLSEISGACHPMDVPSWETDIQAIRATLNEILFHVTKQTAAADEVADSGGRHDS